MDLKMYSPLILKLNNWSKNKMSKQSMVTITEDEYNQLIYNSKVLEALHQGGVDNWEWYDESLKLMDEEE